MLTWLLNENFHSKGEILKIALEGEKRSLTREKRIKLIEKQLKNHY